MNKEIENLNKKYSDDELVAMLQKYVPKILKNDAFFQRLKSYLLEEYKFKANEEHLQRKLKRHFDESFRTDVPKLGLRLIKGVFVIDTDLLCLWLHGREVALIAEYIVEGD